MNKPELTPEQTIRNQKFFETVSHMLNVKNDAELGKALDINAPTISKMSNGRMRVGCSAMIKIHEATGMPFETIRLYIPKN